MTEPDFWAQQWQHWICEDCDLTLPMCTCDVPNASEATLDQVETFLQHYSA